MSSSPPSGPDLFGFADDNHDKARNATYGSPEETYHRDAAQYYATAAQTAALVMLTGVIASATGIVNSDLDGWRKVISRTPWEECQARHIRRPQCSQRHTEDCAYADPKPEPKHVLLPVGTRVLVSDTHKSNCVCGGSQPYVGKIVGYDMGRTKYEINEERYGNPGNYYTFTWWAFADNRVQIHPDSAEEN